MGFITFIGRLFLISSIVFQAFLLYQDKKEGDQFNKNLNAAIRSCHLLAPYRQLLLEHLRLAVAGLLASSVLMLLVRSWVLKFPVLLGLIALLWVEHHNVLDNLFKLSVSIQVLDNVALWHSLGVIGAVIYLLGSECTSRKTSKAPVVSQSKAAESSPEKNNSSQNSQARGRAKRA